MGLCLIKSSVVLSTFSTNKGGISNDFISVEKDGDLISDEKNSGTF